MSRVEEWLVAEKRRLERVPSLEDALLGFRPWRYAVYRLRYVFVRAVLRTGFRLLELALFAAAIPEELLGTVLFARSALLLGEAAWWGALERLRSDVRYAFEQRQTGRAAQRIRQWLAFASTSGVASLGLCALWITIGPSDYGSFSAIDAYLLACGLRWSTDALATTYHAGVYGVRRVFRPLWSLLVVDLADVALLGLGFWWLGAWGVALSLAFVGCTRAALSTAFTRRIYSQLNLHVGLPNSWFKAWARLRNKPSPAASQPESNPWLFALGNLIGQADAWIVIAVLSAPASSRGAFVLAALFHVSAPLLGAASAWSRLFYFDFKRLQGWGSPFLLQRFESLLSRVAWWVVLPIGLVVIALLGAFWRGPFLLLGLELTALTAVRARLSLVHMRAYSLGDHPFLLRLFGVLSAATGAGFFAANLTAELALATIVGTTGLGLVWLGNSRLPLEAGRRRGMVSPSLWLDLLLRVPEPVRLGLVRTDRRLATVGRLHHTLKETLSNATFSRLNNDTLVWFEPATGVHTDIATLCAGAAKELQVGEPASTGRLAFKRGLPGVHWKHLVEDLGNLGGAPESHPLGELRAAIVAAANAVELIELNEKTRLSQFDASQSRALRRLLLEAAHGRGGFKKLGVVEVAVVAPAGYPTALVVVPNGAARHTPLRSELMALIQKAERLIAIRGALGHALPSTAERTKPT